MAHDEILLGTDGGKEEERDILIFCQSYTSKYYAARIIVDMYK